ncbi:hypothetical protein GCM10025862_02400 [Arsenicicoccus piscis]|uniref:Uncharacterized protein n=1 Tax=Arsenicicoccus piscis TaxID=673954 RepID=A0ABQ6HHY7_9MICO|nr:hypothetical protein GCM10025862_02400 [Arsenicicoccus piscis]
MLEQVRQEQRVELLVVGEVLGQHRDQPAAAGDLHRRGVGVGADGPGRQHLQVAADAAADVEGAAELLLPQLLLVGPLHLEHPFPPDLLARHQPLGVGLVPGRGGAVGPVRHARELPVHSSLEKEPDVAVAGGLSLLPTRR